MNVEPRSLADWTRSTSDEADNVVLGDANEEVETALVLEQLQGMDDIGLRRGMGEGAIGDLAFVELLEGIEEDIQEFLFACIGFHRAGRGSEE